MSGAASDLFALVAAGAGGTALGFLVALAAVLSVMTILFLGSAVVVLERFARSTRRVRSVLVATAGWALVLAPLARGAIAAAAGRPDEDGPGALAAAVPAVLVALAVGQGAVGLALRFVPARALARAGVFAVAAGFALLVAGAGAARYGAAAAVVATVVAIALALRRRLRSAPLRETERLVRLLAAVVVLGSVASALVPFPEEAARNLGGSLLGAFGAAVLLGILPLATAGLLDARGSVEWFLATRYLFARRRQAFVSAITGICVAGVAAGVWLIITVLSVMNGAERTWRDEIIGNRAHFTVHAARGPIRDYPAVLATIDGVPGVVAAAPYVDGEGMARGPDGAIVPVRVRGVDPDRIARVTDLAADLQPGSERALEALRAPADASNGADGADPPPAGADGADPPPAGADPPLIVGSELARKLGVAVGDAVTLVSPFGGPPTPLGPGPRLSRFRVAGVFASGFLQYDEAFAYTSLAAAQDFRRAGDVAHGIEVRTTDSYRSRQVARDVRAALDSPAWYTRDWKDLFPAFFQSLKTQRQMMFVLLTMIMVVAAFAIVVTLVMMILEKSGDIAILKTMGASEGAIERIFAIEGTLIGLLGTAFGVAAGIAVTTQLARVQAQIEALTGIDTLPATIYQFSTVPWEIDPLQVALVAAIAMVLALGATLLPSRHGARLDPAEALRYE